MLDEGTIRKKVFLRLVGSPFVLAPFVLGMTTAVAVWALNWTPGLGWFAVLAGLLGSAGAYITKLLFDKGETAKTVITECERQEKQARQAMLDELDRRLVNADKDPRPEAALRDMRALLSAFEEIASDVESACLPAVLEVRSKVEQLFDRSVRSLEQTLKLGDIAQKLAMPAARKPIMDERERIIADIQAGVKQLGDTVAALQRLESGGAANSELARMRDELDQSLQLASRVESRLNALLDQPANETAVSTNRQTLAADQ